MLTIHRIGSRGNGQHPGGDGVIRDIEFRIPVQVSILSERRVYHPYGLEGGEDAQCGINLWVRKVPKSDEYSDAANGNGDGVEKLASKANGTEPGQEEEYR